MTKLLNIQILRGIAALMVVVHHCGIEMGTIGERTGTLPFFNFDPWGAGVVLFFGISGFIMVATSSEAFAKPGATADFARRRIVRIVPLYWLVTTVAVVGVALAPQMLSVPVMDAKYIASSYLFWPEARVNGLMRPIATPGWTLNLEMMFYAVFAVALLLPRRLGLGFALLLLGGMAAAHVAGVFAPGGALPSPVLNFWSDPIITGFMLGMGVGILFVHGCRQSFWTMLVLAIVGMVWLLNVPSRPDLPEDDLWVRLSSAIPATIVLAALAFGPQLGLHLRWKWLFAPLLLIGDASYSLYLTHEFLLRPLRVVWQKFTADLLPLWSFLPIGIAISILGGLACYWLFEKPVTNWLSRRLRQRRAIVASDPLKTRAA